MTVVINGTTGITSVNGSAAAPSVTGTDTDTGIVYGTNTVSFSTGGTERLQVDSSGNLGLGVTPSAWISSSKAIQLNTRAALAGDTTFGTNLTDNLYIATGPVFKYLTTAAGTVYLQNAGTHQWYNTPSGTAGTNATVTQAMTLDASGVLQVGVTSQGTGTYGRLVVGGSPSAFSTGNSNVPSGYGYGWFNGSGGSNSDWMILQGPYNNSNHKSGILLQDTFYDNLQYGGRYIQANNQSTTFGKFINGSIGSTNGTLTEHARIDTSGNFMVGGTTGESKISLFSGGSNGFTSGTLPPGMTIYGTTGNGYGAMLSFKAGAGDQGISGVASFRTSGFQTDLRFYTNSTSSANAFSERGRFDPSGGFGVGVTNPSDYGKIAASGSFASITSSNYYSSLFAAAYYRSGFWQNAAEVPNDGVARYIPIVGGAAVTSTQGYVTQAVFGVRKASNASFSAGGYIGVTYNSDGGPGREFLFDINGNFSAPGSKSFKIPHPLPEKAETHDLWHVALEGPSLDLIYRGSANLVNGKAEVNIDTVSRMSEGTFVALTKDAQSFTSNESDWTPVRGSVSGNILSIEAQDNTATSNVSWMVIAKRKDPAALTEGTADSNGEFITERLVG